MCPLDDPAPVLTPDCAEYVMSCVSAAFYPDMSPARLHAFARAVEVVVFALRTSGDVRTTRESLVRACASDATCALAVPHVERHSRDFAAFLSDARLFVARHSHTDFCVRVGER